MQVKIGNTIYDATKEPIMLILNDSDKKNLLNMPANASKYAGFPENWFNSEEEVQEWMEVQNQNMEVIDGIQG